MAEFQAMHQHCSECVSRVCDALVECPVVSCPHGCGVLTHQCKMLDHEELCTEKVVPCTNATYGCEVEMSRHEIREHLAYCSVSSSEARELLELSNEAAGCAHGCGAAVYKYDVLDHDEMCTKKLVSCTNAVYGCEAVMPQYKIKAHLAHCPASVVCCKFKLHYPTGIASPSLRFYTPTELAYRQQMDVLRNCKEVVRRDEFEDHHIIQHSIIHDSLYGWLVHHCPMSEDNCCYGMPQLLLSSKFFMLVYNECSRMFAVTPREVPVSAELDSSESASGWYMSKLQEQRELAAFGYDEIPTDPLSGLPIEILGIIISYLDSSALFCLSLTNRILREACRSILKGNIVQLTWTRDGEGWKESTKVWRYSHNPQVSHDWQFTNNDSAVNKHLQQCPYAAIQESYDDKMLWHCVTNGINDETTLYQRVPSSSVDLAQLKN